MRLRNLVPLLTAVLLATSGLAQPAFAALDLSDTPTAKIRVLGTNAVKITGTSKGRQLTAEAAARKGSAIASAMADGARFDAYREELGAAGKDAFWLVPLGTSPDNFISETTSNSVVITTTDSPTPMPESLRFKPSNMRRAGSFEWQSPVCAARYNESMGWMDRCSQWGKRMSDGDTARDHWVFQQYATCKSITGTRLDRCWLSGDKGSTSATMYWEDWAPASDSQGSCRSTTLSVQAYGIIVGGSYDHCEELDITKYAAPGSFRNDWYKYGGVPESERAVRYRVAFGVPQNGTPVMVASWGIHGYVVCC